MLKLAVDILSSKKKKLHYVRTVVSNITRDLSWSRWTKEKTSIVFMQIWQLVYYLSQSHVFVPSTSQRNWNVWHMHGGSAKQCILQAARHARAMSVFPKTVAKTGWGHSGSREVSTSGNPHPPSSPQQGQARREQSTHASTSSLAVTRGSRVAMLSELWQMRMLSCCERDRTPWAPRLLCEEHAVKSSGNNGVWQMSRLSKPASQW